MNENIHTVKLSNYLTGLEGWGRTAGIVAVTKLRQHINALAPADLVRISLQGVKRIDVTFAREAIIGLVSHYRGSVAICLVDLAEGDVFDNVAAAAAGAGIPLAIWHGGAVQMVGKLPSHGNAPALALVLERAELRAADLAAVTKTSTANASTKLKQLHEQGFIMRRQNLASSGGIEFIYRRIG